MPNEIQVTPANVRAAINISYGEGDLPNSLIDLSIYSRAAIIEIQERDPDYATRNADEATRLNNAADYLTAALLLPAIPNLMGEKIGDESWQYKPIDVDKEVARLRGLVEQELNGVLNPGSSTASMPTVFGLASGRRGL